MTLHCNGSGVLGSIGLNSHVKKTDLTPISHCTQKSLKMIVDLNVNIKIIKLLEDNI